MRWVRSRIRLGSWSALLALTMQLALSFGHVHLEGIRKDFAAALGRAVQPAVSAAVTPDDPAQHSPHSCAICSAIRLGSVPAIAPALPLLFRVSDIAPGVDADAPLTVLLHFFFEARGPPHV
jgi:hypothetical protein